MVESIAEPETKLPPEGERESEPESATEPEAEPLPEGETESEPEGGII